MSQRRRRPYRTHSTSSDSSSTSSTPLDEEQQEALITSLAARDIATTQRYQRLFLLVPLLAGAYVSFTFLSSLRSPSSSFLSSPTSTRETLTFLLSMTSILSSAWQIYTHAADPTIATTNPARSRPPSFKAALARSPLERLLPALLQPVVAGLLGVIALGEVRRAGRGVYAGRALLGVVVYAFGVVAKRLLRGLDLEGLRERRYDLKGA